MPCTGIDTCRELFSLQNSLRPASSLPRRIAVGLLKSALHKHLGAPGEEATIAIFRSFSHVRHEGLSATTTRTSKNDPCEARITLGLKISETGSVTMSASAPAALAVRMRVPRLPGFSMCSIIRIKGQGLSGMLWRRFSHMEQTPRRPSGFSR